MEHQLVDGKEDQLESQAGYSCVIRGAQEAKHFFFGEPQRMLVAGIAGHPTVMDGISLSLKFSTLWNGLLALLKKLHP